MKTVDPDREKKMMLRLAAHFSRGADIIKLPYTLEEYESKKESVHEMEKICDELEQREAQVISAIFVDANDVPVLAYCGHRQKTENRRTFTWDNQYEGRTAPDMSELKKQGVDFCFDGLSAAKCEAYQIACQHLSEHVPLHLRVDRMRHGDVNVMEYQSERYEDQGEEQEVLEIVFQEEGQDEKVDKTFLSQIQQQHAYVLDSQEENAGVAHLVHGWIQQAQKKKGLFLSGDISNSSSSFQASCAYFTSTQSVAFQIDAYLSATFPDWAKRYKKAFGAGAMVPNDPGPFIGRAIIYKLQGKAHRDCRDAGPSASFGVGQYSGGCLLMPQLRAKFRYEPGAFCIFFSSIFWHKVASFTPFLQTMEMREKDIIPGRIGTVFFFPKPSLEVLESEDEGWGLRTHFGKFEGWDSTAHSERFNLRKNEELEEELAGLEEEAQGASHR